MRGAAAAHQQRQILGAGDRLALPVDQEREQIGGRKRERQPFDVVAHVRRRRRAVVHPRGIGVGHHPEVQTRTAARHVLDEQIRIAPAQLVEEAVEGLDVRQVAVRRAVAVTRAIAVDPEVVVPLQVIGVDALDERDQLVHHPLAAGRAGQADLRVERRAVVAAACGQPRLLSETGLADGGERHALGLDPQAELHADAVRVVGEARQPRRKAVRIGGPRSETRVEVEVAGLPGAEIPAGVHHEQLDAERRRAIDFGDHRVLVDPGAVDEPGVVGDERLERRARAECPAARTGAARRFRRRWPSPPRRRTRAGSRAVSTP